MAYGTGHRPTARSGPSTFTFISLKSHRVTGEPGGPGTKPATPAAHAGAGHSALFRDTPVRRWLRPSVSARPRRAAAGGRGAHLPLAPQVVNICLHDVVWSMHLSFMLEKRSFHSINPALKSRSGSFPGRQTARGRRPWLCPSSVSSPPQWAAAVSHARCPAACPPRGWGRPAQSPRGGAPLPSVRWSGVVLIDTQRPSAGPRGEVSSPAPPPAPPGLLCGQGATCRCLPVPRTRAGPAGRHGPPASAARAVGGLESWDVSLHVVFFQTH